MTHQSDRSTADSEMFDIGGDHAVKRIGFGAMRLPGDQEKARTLLRRAVKLGVNFIDTADAYGSSEDLIKQALYPYPENVLIATKGGLVFPKDGGWHADGRPEYLKKACERSLKRLGVEQIDLYQLHLPDPGIPFEESIGALAELRKEGKVRYIGVSNVDVLQLEAAMEIVPIASVQNRYNIIERDNDAIVDTCGRYDIAFLPYFPLRIGNLAQPGGSLDEIAANHDATSGQIALAWLLHRSPVIVPIPGTSSVEHLQQNVAAASVSLSRKDMKTLDSMKGSNV